MKGNTTLKQRKPRKEKSPFGLAVLAACQGKAEREDLKSYPVHRLCLESGVAQSHLTRCMNGDGILSQKILERLSQTLGCTEEEQAEMYHSAGYLAPGERKDATRVA